MVLQRKALRRIAEVMMVIGVLAALLVGVGWETKAVHGSGSCGGGPNPGCGGGLICPLVFEAVIGSGEKWRGNGDLSVSPALSAVYKNTNFPPNFVDSDGSSKPIVSVVDYPAENVTTLLTNFNYGPQIYLDSEKQGFYQLGTDFFTARSRCSSTTFVLAGYSQGAMVVHDFLDELAAHGTAAEQQSIIGAVLVADPDRVKHSAVRELSTAPSAAYGLCDIVSTLHIGQCPAAGPLQDVAPMFRSRTVSVCADGDSVCDTSDLVGPLDLLGGPGAWIGSIARGIGIHKSYQNLSATGNAGTVMSQLIAAF